MNTCKGRCGACGVWIDRRGAPLRQKSHCGLLDETVLLLLQVQR